MTDSYSHEDGSKITTSVEWLTLPSLAVVHLTYEYPPLNGYVVRTECSLLCGYDGESWTHRPSRGLLLAVGDAELRNIGRSAHKQAILKMATTVKIQHVRDTTHCTYLDARKALLEAGGNSAKAIAAIRRKGLC